MALLASLGFNHIGDVLQEEIYAKGERNKAGYGGAAAADRTGSSPPPPSGDTGSGAARARAHSGEFNEWQRRWWWQVARTTLLWSAALVALLSVLLAQSEDEALPAQGPGAKRRAWLSVLGAALAWLTLYPDVVRSTPPEQGDVNCSCSRAAQRGTTRT
jgi:hypothetical protein